MSENNKERNGIDWSRVESRMKSAGRTPQSEARGSGGDEQAEQGLERLVVPAAIAAPVAIPDAATSLGILGQFKKGKIDRKATLDALQLSYDAKLAALSFQLKQAVTVSNARADKIAEEFLMKLDSEHLEVLKDLGLRNLDTRSTALIEVRAMIAAKLAEVQTKNWPQSLIDETIDDLLALKQRVCNEMMRELGASR